jgi:hypothetical protein
VPDRLLARVGSAALSATVGLAASLSRAIRTAPRAEELSATT